MEPKPVASLPRPYGKWCAFILILLTPGSFVVLPVVWLIRYFVRGETFFMKPLFLWRTSPEPDPKTAPVTLASSSGSIPEGNGATSIGAPNVAGQRI